jgi:DNA repair protein RecO (recombination protein O)
MSIEKIEAVVMRSFPLRETSRIVHLLSAERGRIHVVVKGARGPRNRFGAALEPFTRIGAVIYYRPERDLQFLSQAEILTRRSSLAASLHRFAYASAVIELADQALAGEEPVKPIYSLVDDSLETLARIPEAQVRLAFMAYVARLLSALGYRPELERCVRCGREPEAAFFAPQSGGIACRSCAGTEAGRIQPAVLAGLRRLVQGGELAAEPRAVTDEMARALDAFLRAHLPRYRGLRSLTVAQEAPGGIHAATPENGNGGSMPPLAESADGESADGEVTAEVET